MTSHRTDPVYLDHAATTPMRPEAIAAMVEELGHLGNPSSLHAAGRRARRVVEESREQLAEVFGARPSEVIFTSGGTEADNLAVKGLYWARQDGAARRRDRHRVLTTSVEHHAVLDSVRWLEEAQGAEVVWLAVGDDGMVRPAALRAAIAQAPEQVAVVSVMWANNEVGTVQPVSELAAVAHEYGVPFHTDAVQAAAQLPVDFAASGADALTVTGHKLGGPVGVGALILARGAAPVPVLHGGGQERDVRSGTLDTPAIRAFAVAAAACAGQRAEEAERLAALRDDLVRQVLAAVPDAVLNGPPPGPTGCRATRTSPSPAARATRCSCCSTRTASPAPPVRPAPRAWPSPATCCWPWAPTTRAPAARSASPSATPRPSTTSTPSAWSSARWSTAPAAPPPADPTPPPAHPGVDGTSAHAHRASAAGVVRRGA